MRIHKRKVAMIGIAVVMIASLAGCGASEWSDKNNVTPGAESVAASGQAVSEAAAEEDTRVAELEQVPPPEEYFCKQDVGDFTVYIYSGDAKKVVENISPLDGMYEGEYYIDVYQGNERRDSSFYEIMGNRTNYFYKGFELGVTDYNKDGLYDFALGNRLSSNYYEYRFYSVDSEGKLRVLLDHKGNEMMITANNDGFSPIFKTNERTVYYISYDGIAGEYRENNAVFSDETAFVNENVNPFLTETGQVIPVTEVKVTDKEPDDSVIVGLRGVGPEMSVSLTSDTKYNIYNGKYGSDGLELLSRVTSKQFRRYVKKELKIRDHEMKDAPHYCEPTCFGLPFLIEVKDGKCQVVTECYEV